MFNKLLAKMQQLKQFGKDYYEKIQKQSRILDKKKVQSGDEQKDKKS